MKKNVSIKAAIYLKRYWAIHKKSTISLKKFLYSIKEPGKRKKRIQRIIYGIYTYWNLLERLVREANLTNNEKMHYYLVAAYRLVVDKWSIDQLKEHMGSKLTDGEISKLSIALKELSDVIDKDLSLKYGFPKLFIDTLKIFFNDDELKLALESFNKRVSTWLVVNALKNEENYIVRKMEEEGYSLVKDDEIPLLYKVTTLPKKLQDSLVYKRGLILPMQKASAAVVKFLDPKGDTIYDACAAPGVKSIFSIILSGGESKVIALDISKQRILRMKNLVKMYEVSDNIEIYRGDARFFTPKKDFDKALVDAPCTSSGTISKNPELKYNIDKRIILNFSILQYDILKQVVRLSRSNTEIVYATCSIFPEENELVIRKVLGREKDLMLIIPELGISAIDNLGKRFWPHIHDTIGMFYTKLLKR